MKHSNNKAKKLQQPRNPKFSCFLACFGGGQPSAKKLAYDHSKNNKSRRHHHHHRWLLSPYWSNIRIKQSAASGSNTLPLELFGVSPPMMSSKSKSLAGGKPAPGPAEPDKIHVVDKADQQASSLISLKCSHHNKFPTLPRLEEEEEEEEEARKADSTSPHKTTQSLKGINKSERLSKLDPLFGLSMVMLTLLIMVIWGRLCAILCTCAWFYFVPRCNSHAPNEILNSELDGHQLGMSSTTAKQSKKRIVLDGFLERGNRRELQLNV